MVPGGAAVTDPAFRQRAVELDAGNGPFRLGRILTGAAQCQLHGKSHAGKLRVGHHHRIEAPHVLVVIRMQVGDAQVVDAARQQRQMVLRRQQQFQFTAVELHQMRDQHLVAARQRRAQRGIVGAADLRIRQVELLQPGLGADLVDEVQADGLGARLRQHIHGAPEMRRPERQRIILQRRQRIVIHADHRSVFRHVAHAGDHVPIVVVDVFDRLQPAGARQADGGRTGQQRHQDITDQDAAQRDQAFVARFSHGASSSLRGRSSK